MLGGKKSEVENEDIQSLGARLNVGKCPADRGDVEDSLIPQAQKYIEPIQHDSKALGEVYKLR